MPGATATNIRKADIAEDLGKLLLRQFCSLAPITKADDFGIDTIATILKIDENSALRELANKTFGIQFKSKSVREIEFIKDYEYNWLLNLDYPYFIGSVNIKDSSMEIYSLHIVNCLPSLNSNCNGLIITLDEINENNQQDGILTLSLGEPVLTLKISETANTDLIYKKRDILSKWIDKEYDNIKVRNIGLTKGYNWKTNEAPFFDTVNKIFTNKEDLSIYNESFDFIDAVLTELKMFNKDRHLQKGINTINTKLKQKGIELFLLNNYETMIKDKLEI
ncbi:hypothetical protein [uncultured Formosa sp.]|uniref:hypothetical protein n=1 Tax=uncultured Formosa sp. TaxID=255435 RepID=UPI0026256638|nr:hypothetical protein [uncultured Formosa sp.]